MDDNMNNVPQNSDQENILPADHTEPTVSEEKAETTESNNAVASQQDASLEQLVSQVEIEKRIPNPAESAGHSQNTNYQEQYTTSGAAGNPNPAQQQGYQSYYQGGTNPNPAPNQQNQYQQNNYSYQGNANAAPNSGYQTNYYKDPNSEIMTVGDWMLTILPMLIPCLGIVLYFVWAFSSNTNQNRKNYCRASLIFTGIGVAIYLVIVIFAFAVTGSALGRYY